MDEAVLRQAESEIYAVLTKHGLTIKQAQGVLDSVRQDLLNSVVGAHSVQ